MVSLLFFYMEKFSIKLPMKVDMPLNLEIKATIIQSGNIRPFLWVVTVKKKKLCDTMVDSNGAALSQMNACRALFIFLKLNNEEAWWEILFQIKQKKRNFF